MVLRESILVFEAMLGLVGVSLSLDETFLAARGGSGAANQVDAAPDYVRAKNQTEGSDLEHLGDVDNTGQILFRQEINLTIPLLWSKSS